MAERKANSLTPKQQAIINLNSYPQYLRAGAGTGKTEVLIQKIIHIIRSEPKTSLKDFGIITFTNKATDEMRMRLTDSLYHEWLNVLDKEEQQQLRFNVEIASMIDLSTIHGFCENLLRNYGLAIGVASNFKIKSFRHKINEVIGEIVNENYDHPLVKNIPQYKINKLMSILLISNSDHGYVIDKPSVDKANFNTKENDYWNEVKCFFLDLYLKAYNKIEELKQHENTLTPNDLIKKTVELLSNEHILRKLSNKYKYLFIDEFQDTNKDQFDLVKLLITAGVKVFLVGDDKQSVYAFRGADIQNSRQMSNIISQLQTGDHSPKLDENFRTDASLISIINNIFKHNFTFNEQKIAFPLEPLSIPASKEGTGVDEP
ncbi:MAG: UvrD-helicase domain-containing protein, partial [Dysgonamonadaceae bacterium]|nr:UvrD-helicase domain-containing protein [Dysgonamonadaceae bacterium]